MKLERGTIYKIQTIPRKKRGFAKRKNKHLNRPSSERVTYSEILRAFGITILAIFNLALLCATLLWFSLIFTIVTPTELTEMVVGEAISEIVFQTNDFSTIPPAPQVAQ